MTDAERKIQRLIRQLDASHAENLKLRMEVEILQAKVNRLSLLSLPSLPTQGCACDELARALRLKSEALELAMSLLEKQRAHADCLAARAANLANLYQAAPPDPQDALLDGLLAEIAEEAEKGQLQSRTTEGESAEAASKQVQEAEEEVHEGLASTSTTEEKATGNAEGGMTSWTRHSHLVLGLSRFSAVQLALDYTTASQSKTLTPIPCVTLRKMYDETGIPLPATHRSEQQFHQADKGKEVQEKQSEVTGRKEEGGAQ